MYNRFTEQLRQNIAEELERIDFLFFMITSALLLFQIDPPSETQKDAAEGLGLTAGGDDVSSDDARTSLQSPRSQNTSREEDESSNANESDTKSPNQRYLIRERFPYETEYRRSRFIELRFVHDN